jgi:hypothetical protein
MKKFIVAAFSVSIFLFGCVKDEYRMYNNSYYIHAPLLDNNQTFLNPSYYNNSVSISKTNKLRWKFEQQLDNLFVLKSADSSLKALTDSSGYAILQLITSPVSQSQKFRLIPTFKNKNLVSLQSVASGKYVTLEYCYFGSDSVRYSFQMEDQKACHAYLLDTLQTADTTYCVQQFELK